MGVFEKNSLYFLIHQYLVKFLKNSKHKSFCDLDTFDEKITKYSMKKYENFKRRIKMEWVQEILYLKNSKWNNMLWDESQEVAELLRVCLLLIIELLPSKLLSINYS